MTKRYKNSFREKVLEYIQQLPDNVILRTDLNKLGSQRQVTRALNLLLRMVLSLE